MKALNYLVMAALALFSLSACSPEEYNDVNQAQVPNASDYAVNVNVDQDNNVATFTLTDKSGNPAKGVYPIWSINTGSKVQSTVNGYTTSKIVLAGDYTYSVQVGNYNGISDGSLDGQFTINTTRFDFTNFINHLCGGTAEGTQKQWRVYATKKEHMHMFGPGSNWTEHWWAADPNAKINDGMYDDLMTFTAGSSLSAGQYNYSAGEDGRTLVQGEVNTLGFGAMGSDNGVNINSSAAVFDAPFTLGYDASFNDNDGAVTITLPAGTIIPYVANNSMITGETTYTVESIDDKTMVWAFHVPSADWKLIFISGDDPASEAELDPDDVNWADVNSDLNLVKGFNEQKLEHNAYWANDSWTPITAPAYSFENGVHTLSVLQANGWSQWQGQLPLVLDGVNLAGGENYDIAFNVRVSEEQSNVTIKICQDVEGDTPVLLDQSGVTLKRGNNLIRYAKRALDGDITRFKLLLDMPGTPAGAEISVSNVLVQKHNRK